MNLRFSKIKQLITDQNLDAVLISSNPNIIYLTNYSNFSKVEREAFLLITNNNQYIFTDGRYATAVKKHIKNFELVEIFSGYNFYEALNKILLENKIKRLGIEESNLTVSEFKKIKQIIPNIKSANLNNLRIIKALDEIKAIEKACRLGDKAFKYILKEIKPGLTEKQIAYKLESFIRENGGDLSFSTIVAFGGNAAVPHHQTNNQRLKTKDLILLDFGVKLDNYCSDMTRTVFLDKATNEQRKVYETVLKAQQKAVSYLESCFLNLNSSEKIINSADVDRTARDYIISSGFSSIPHSLGHGIGIEVHEPPTLSPVSKHTLTNGMVFSIEPGIYLPGKFGVRIEDLFAIQNGKLRQLTNSPKKLTELT